MKPVGRVARERRDFVIFAERVERDVSLGDILWLEKVGPACGAYRFQCVFPSVEKFEQKTNIIGVIFAETFIEDNDSLRKISLARPSIPRYNILGTHLCRLLERSSTENRLRSCDIGNLRWRREL